MTRINEFEFSDDVVEVNAYEVEYMKEFADEIAAESEEELRDFLIRD